MNQSVRSPIEFPEKMRDGDHLVQFYKTESHLAETVVNYSAPALLNGEGVIIIATEAHLQEFEKGLKELHLNTSLMRLSGQLMMFEARSTLDQFMVDGMPDPEKFNALIGATLANMKSRYSTVKAYGEMVNILWNEGNLYGTMALESLWNELLSQKHFTLLCAYSLQGLSEEKQGIAFHEVCQCHSHVIPAEGVVEVETSKEQLMKIAELQFSVFSGHKYQKDLKSNARELMIPLTAMKIYLRDMKNSPRKEDIDLLIAKCEKQLEKMGTIIEKLGL